MQNFRESVPYQSFASFSPTLKQKYGVEPTRQNRKNWEDLTLEKKDRRLDLREWNLFKENFLLYRQRVEDRTDEEEYHVIILAKENSG
jgi:hypothetical protein